MNRIRLLGAFVGLVVFACGSAWSQQYPAKPVRVVVVFPPGGATDVVARFVFQKVGEQLNQQFIIDNRTLDPMYMTPEDFTKHLKTDYDRLKEVVKLSGARIE